MGALLAAAYLAGAGAAGAGGGTGVGAVAGAAGTAGAFAPLVGGTGTITPGEIGISGTTVMPLTQCRVSPKQLVGKPTFSS